LNAASRIAEVLPPEVMLPAVGQGALGMEFLAAREDEFSILNQLVDQDTMRAVTAERTVLAALQGGCRLPLGAWGRFESGKLVLDACVLSADGAESVRGHASAACASAEDATKLGREVA